MILDAFSQTFRRGETRAPFIPWGFNYDRDAASRLIEDYWVSDWRRVEEDFADMRALGANVVRVHLQFARVIPAPSLTPDPEALERLAALLKLAERNGLYLDITGLGCYRAADVPRWYDELEEDERWAAQAAFWEAVAGQCASSPAVFCYNLMNEPVAPVGSRPARGWLGPPFGGFCYVQFISLDQAGRARPAIARAWIRTLVAAIRRNDPQRLITVGLVDWSLDRPGLTSGFVPAEIAPEVDVLSVHLYPEAGAVPQALETLRQFATGKPVLIEETYPLRCSIEEMRRFLDGSRRYAAGCLSFYWGQPPSELDTHGSMPAAIMAAWLREFQSIQPSWKPARSP